MQQILKWIKDSLAGYYPAGEIDAFIRLIFGEVCNYSLTDILLRRDEELSGEVRERIETIVLRLQHYEPIQYLLGVAYFGELRMAVGPGVLIPRPETWEMVQRIVSEQGEVEGRVADFCTGSGCIAIALAKAWRNAAVEGWDFSSQALQYARRNGEANGVEVQWRMQDLLAYEPATQPRYAVIVSNPPYVLDSERETMDDNVLRYEPHSALFVPDDDPLLFYRAIARIACSELLPGGALYCEINAAQGEACKDLLRSCGMEQVEVYRDFMGMDRVLKGIKPRVCE